MRTPRRAAAAAALLVPAAIVLAGCAETSSATGRDGQVTMPATTPATFQDHAMWQAPVHAQAPVQIVPGAILAFADNTDEGQYSPVLRDDDTGEILWQGRAVSAQQTPTLDWVEDDGRAWVVVSATDDTSRETKVYAWDARTSEREASTTSSATFTGEDNAPTVTVSDTGVLVEGAEEADALQFHPASGTYTKYGQGPERDGDPGEPLAVHNDGYLIEFPDGGFSYATDSGGWKSTSAVPDGAQQDGGQVLAVDHGLIVSRWDGQGEGEESADPVVAVHSLQDGALLAQASVADPDVDAALTDEAEDENTLTVVTDHRSLAYGPVVFDLTQGTGKLVEINDGHASAIIDGVLYLDDLAQPLPDQSAEGFAGAAAVDLATGTLVSGDDQMSPLGETGVGQGLFRSEDGAQLYSVAST